MKKYIYQKSLPHLPHGKTVRVGDYARECIARKNVAAALNIEADAREAGSQARALFALFLLLWSGAFAVVAH